MLVRKKDNSQLCVAPRWPRRKPVSGAQRTQRARLRRGISNRCQLIFCLRYAMKVLKKLNLVARRQVEHTRAERNILMRMAGVPFIGAHPGGLRKIVWRSHLVPPPPWASDPHRSTRGSPACLPARPVHVRYGFQTADKLYLVMDFMQGGELFFHLKKSGPADPPPAHHTHTHTHTHTHDRRRHTRAHARARCCHCRRGGLGCPTFDAQLLRVLLRAASVSKQRPPPVRAAAEQALFAAGGAVLRGADDARTGGSAQVRRGVSRRRPPCPAPPCAREAQPSARDWEVEGTRTRGWWIC